MGRKLDIDLKPTNFKGKQSNTLQMLMLRQAFKGQETGEQIQVSGQNVPGELPEGVDPDDFRQVPKVREIGGQLIQNPEWERKPDPDKTEADVIGNIDQTISQLDNLARRMKSGEFSTGPFNYKWTQLPFAGRTMKAIGSPEEQSFRQSVDRMLQSYLLAQSGVQRGFKEIQWLASAVPNTEQYPAAFLDASETLKSEMLTNRSNAVNTLRQRGKAISGLRDYVPTESEVGNTEQPEQVQNDDPLGIFK